jgi:hypothetical protein
LSIGILHKDISTLTPEIVHYDEDAAVFVQNAQKINQMLKYLCAIFHLDKPSFVQAVQLPQLIFVQSAIFYFSIDIYNKI